MTKKREKHQNYMFEMFNGILIKLKEAKKYVKNLVQDLQKCSKTVKNDQKWLIFHVFSELDFSKMVGSIKGYKKWYFLCFLRKT